jgi:outer membrane protein assembly factor BamB
MYGFDPARTGATGSRPMPPGDAGARRFSRTAPGATAGGGVEAPPAVGDGVVYSAGDTGVEARGLATGERRWRVDPGAGVSTSPVLACGAVLVSTLDGTVALDRADGARLWEAAVGGGTDPGESPAVDGRDLVLGSGARLHVETGRRASAVDVPGLAAAGVAVADHVVVCAVNRDEGAVVSATRDGEVRWRRDVGPVYAAPAVADGSVYAVDRSGSVVSLAAADGAVEWRAPVPQGVYDPPAVADGRVHVAAGNGARASALDAATGDRLWTRRTGPSMGSPAVYGDRVLLPGANTGVHAVDAATGEPLRHWSAPAVGSTPVLAGGRLFYRSWARSETFVVG